MFRRCAAVACVIIAACGGDVAQLEELPPPDWSTSFASSWDARVVVAAGSKHGLAVAGHFGDTVDFAGTTLRSSGREDVLVARFAPGGRLIWARGFGGPGDDEASAVAIAATGEIYVAGRFAGAIDFGGGMLEDAGSVDLAGRPITGRDGSDLFLAAFDASGAHLWSLRFGQICMDDPDYGVCSDWGEELGGLAVRPAGGVCLAASAQGMLDLGDLDGRPVAPWNAAFAACLDSDGRLEWLVPLEEDSRAASIGIDGVGNVYVLSYVGSRTFSLHAFDADGGPRRHHTFRHGRGVFHTTLAARADGGVILTGTFHGRLDLNEAVLEAPGPELSPEQGISTDRELFLASFDPEGRLEWARDFGAATESHESGTAVVPLAHGGLAVGGYYEDPVDLGGGPLPDAQDRSTNLLLARFGAAGDHVWSATYGDDGPDSFDSITSLSALPSGHLCFAASFGGTLTLPTGAHQADLAQAAAFGCMRPLPR